MNLTVASRPPSVTKIIAASSIVCGVPTADIIGPQRDAPDLVDARHIAMYVTRQVTAVVLSGR